MVSRTARTRDVDAEAAAWVARLHGARTNGTEAALHAWLAEDSAHEAAFERATEIWAIIPGAARQGGLSGLALTARQRRRPLPAPVLALAASLLLLLGSGGLWWSFMQSSDYATQPGEQRVATLEDGSRIALNTDTALKLSFEADRRMITLDRGEAMFEVAHDAARPFTVVAGDATVRAVGTVFIVRRTRDDVMVTLVDGKVAVSKRGGSKAGDAERKTAILKPGERLTAPREGAPIIAPQSIEAATAWRRGQVIFGDTPLASAVSELNRYGGPTLVIEDARVAALPVSGVFATNDSAEFAQAVAALHGLRVEKSGSGLHITR